MKVSLSKITSLRETTPLQRLENPPTGIPRYNINGEGYYSVTQVLDDGKFAKIAPNLLLHSQILGSVVHLKIENFFKNRDPLYNIEESLEESALKLYNFLPEPSEKDWNTYLHYPSDPDNAVEEIVLKRRISTAYDHFTSFLQNHEVEPLWSEEIIWNPNYLYAGTVDLLCYLDGKLTIVDHKTSRFLDDTKESIDNYTGQLSAYANAIRTLEGEDFDIDLKLLHLDPLGKKYKIVHRKYNFDVFLDAHVRFSQTKFLPNQEEMAARENIKNKQESTERTISKESNEQFKEKTFECPVKNCKTKSTFPFPNKNDFLISNNVKTIIKIAYHEKQEHYAIFHINSTDFSLQKSFIQSRNS